MPKLIQGAPDPVQSGGINVRADQNVFSGGSDFQQIAEITGMGADKIATIETTRRNRNDAINILRAADKFYNDVFAEYNRVQSEGDIIDPSTSQNFAEMVRTKQSEYLANFQGSEEARIKLEQELTNQTGNFTRQMTQISVNAQKAFVMSKASEQINMLANEVRQDPTKIGEIYNKANALIDEISPALYAEDEISLISAAQDQIATTALRSYTDSGQYEEARDLINENPFFLQNMSAASQREILTQIQSGIAEKEKVQRETRQRIDAYRAAADELGVDISPNALFGGVTGIQQAQTPEAKVEEFARVTGKNVDELPSSVIAKIGFGVDLGGSEVDFNKNYTPDGNLTPKGIQEQVKEPFEKAAAAKMYQTKTVGAINLFRNDGNKQALLSAMINFQKALDEGAVVREGDIVLQREAQGLSDRISLFVKPGQVVGDELVDEMEATINDFTAKVLESSLSQIDPYIKDAQERGYRPLDYGIPREAYEQVFSGVKKPEKTAKIESGEITADDFLRE